MRVLRVLCRHECRGFVRKDDGAATVEAVIWLPLFVFLVAFATDVSMIFHAHSRVLRVTQDVNRAISVGRIESTDDAEDAVVAMLPNYDSVTASIDVSNGIITANVSVPVSSVVAIGMVSSLMGHTINVRTQQYLEQ
jgi:Flp pilus assembly protein TadG